MADLQPYMPYIIIGLTVGLSGADIVLDSLSITAGQTVTINTAVITHAA